MDSSDRYIGMLLDNRYEILEKIGAGGMAVVYKARCHRLNRLVAVKILKEDLAGDDEFRRRFHTESQAVAMLSHPNIVAVYDVSRTGNIEYIVMELIEGITLKQYINRKGLLNWKEALHFAAQITKALAHAHAKGIIHRDIKPHNIMILKDGSVKVADFGIAQLLSSQNTLTQGSMGSVHYISPEQAKGGRVDARTDIYSVGVVMYEMLTSQLPFVGDSAVSIAIQHISAIPLMPRDINPDVPPGLEDIAMHAMEPDMNMRYATADEMLLDLEEFRKNPAVLFNYAVLTAKQDAADPSATKPVPSGAILKTESALPSVRPVRAPKKPELTRDEYRNVHKRSGRTSVMIGVFVIIAFLILVFLFMWNYFISDLFVKPEMLKTPSFLGQRLTDVLNDGDYARNYSFESTSEDYSDTAETGVIIAQNPQPDREKVMPTDGGRIAVELTVSLGPRPAVKMPDLVNKDFWTAQSILEDYKLDLDVQTESVVSDEVTENYVIRTVPEAGAALVKGKTVSIFYSAGPERKTTTVPNVVGRTESAAKLMLEDRRLTPDIKHVDDNAEEGTVFFQSEPEGKTVDEHAVITIHVSNGPPPTPTPSEEPSPSPTEEPSPEPSPTPDFPPDDVWGVQGDPPPTTGSEPQI